MEFSGFYKLSVDERRKLAAEFAQLSQEEGKLLETPCSLPLGVADRMIENVIGSYPLPYGVATNFVINGTEVLVPMVIEEPSVVAAASNAAKLCKSTGGFIASSTAPIMIGQMALFRLEDAQSAFEKLQKGKEQVIGIAKKYAGSIEQYGGGVRGLDMELLDSQAGKILLLKFYIDVRDAMGANTINTIMELSSPEIEQMAGGKARVKILSNLAIKRIARASAKWSAAELGGSDVVDRILEGYELAVVDPFRCATHNKGIMNGIDALAIATGQDWRAIEAGCHAYAAWGGKYRPLTRYYKDKNGDLIGEIEIPAQVGIVGGAIKTHPVAAIGLKLLKAQNAAQLGEALAAVGLAQNFAALRAITTEGIQKGHMRLHAKNIAVNAGAQGEQIETVAKALVDCGTINVSKAKEILEGMNK
ncbi:hydroxymethylglutaryl-CoA reductase, degradative [Candidatus Parvarchaeota archaeon]|nr:hydroxymethylglutaryl-CoA reductase, degradative [Candidatus Parvarchaeota archaeon]